MSSSGKGSSAFFSSASATQSRLGKRSSLKARRIRSQPSATLKSRSWRSGSGGRAGSVSSARAAVTSRSTSVMKRGRFPHGARVPTRESTAAVLRSASGRDMPAMARDLSESRCGHRYTFSSEPAERLLNRVKPRVQLPLQQHQRVSRRQQELHADD